MNSITKVTFLFLASITFFILICYVFIENWIIQTGYFIFINLLFLTLKGRNTYFKLAHYWFKFATFILFIYFLTWLLVSYFGFNYGCNEFSVTCLNYWLCLGGRTSILLINTVLTIELLILSVTINDIVSLPISIKYLKVFILTRTLLLQATSRFENNIILVKTIPEFQLTYKISFKNLKVLFHKNIILMLTFIFYILEQSEILGELIDNRIKHNHLNK